MIDFRLFYDFAIKSPNIKAIMQLRLSIRSLRRNVSSRRIPFDVRNHKMLSVSKAIGHKQNLLNKSEVRSMLYKSGEGGEKMERTTSESRTKYKNERDSFV